MFLSFFSAALSACTNTNKHCCHSGLLLRASESLQMGPAKCWCQSTSAPKKWGHLLGPQVTTGHLHMHIPSSSHTLISKGTLHKCKQSYIVVENINKRGTIIKYFKDICLWAFLWCFYELWTCITHTYVSTDCSIWLCVSRPPVMSGCRLQTLLWDWDTKMPMSARNQVKNNEMTTGCWYNF